MPEFIVTGVITGSAPGGKFEAEDADDAKDQFLEQHESLSLCHKCARIIEEPQLTNIIVEKVEESDE